MEEKDPLVGTRLGPCILEALVGRGGMGRVYRARHQVLDRVVAVKLLDGAGEAARSAALGEARAAAKLDDPRIVVIHEVGEDLGRPFIIMQWVDGETLEGLVRRTGPLAPAQALAVAREVLAALAVAHEAGLVHRDVKPGNILLPAKGGVKLADFGLAAPSGGEGVDGSTMGTFLFMAPEQGYGAAVDARADLYALGATWYYALTGRPPFGDKPSEALLRHREEAPPDPAAARPGVSRRNADLVVRLLAKRPEDRPASAAAALKECAAFGFLLETAAARGDGPFQLLAAPAEAPAPARAPVAAPAPARAAVPPSPPPPPPSSPRGSRAVFVGILALFVLAAVGGSFRKAAPQDWLAACAALGAVVCALTAGERLQAWRKPAGGAAWLLALVCAQRYAGMGVSSVEAMSLAGLGAACGAAAVYLGLWGQDRQEALWARVLAPAGSAMLVTAALTWGAPESQPWAAALTERGRAAWAAFASSGGPWRWLGVAFIAAALVVAARIRPTPPAASPADRKLNWNR